MAKKDNKIKIKEKGKNDKKKKEEPLPELEPDELLLATTDFDLDAEEVQFTDTSYTSASFESLPSIVEEIKPKIKKRRRKEGEQEEVVVKTSETFNWSEESLPIIEEEEEKKVIEEVEPVEKKKKKGKRGKKDKEKKEEIPVFQKPKNWKKMSKKERDKWMEEKIEAWRVEKEAEKQAILAGAKEKRATLARERAELMARDSSEQDVRRDLLHKTVCLFANFENHKLQLEQKKQDLAEWQQYLRCDGLPDPRVTPQMNTYLHLWRRIQKNDDNELEKRCIQTLPMLDLLEELMEISRQHAPQLMERYNEVRLALRAQLAYAIETASYTLLRDLEKNLHFQSVKLATYQRDFLGLRLNLWVAVRMPARKPKPVEPEREPVELAFPELKVSLTLPKTLDASCMCVRAAHSMVDLLSESSRSYPLVLDRANRYEDLFSFSVNEHMETQKLKVEQDEVRKTFYKDVRDKIRELEAFLKANVYAKNEVEQDALDNLNMAEPPFLPDPRTYIGEQHELAFKKYLKKCNTRTRTGELNLRKYRICGGVLNLDLLTIPPQPKRIRDAVTLTTLPLPKCLVPLKYQVQYRAPSPPAEGVIRTPEEIEADMKKMEMEYEKLALVFIELPQTVMWNEPPVVCQWQASRKLWTSNYINDYKFNEDRLTLQFRTGVLWPIGIGTLRYSNMPYQGWDMKPDQNGRGVQITVVGANVTITWLCIGNSVRISNIANSPTPALTEHLNKPYTVGKMAQVMREGACDFFPDFDAHNHVEGSCPKEWVVERHNYHAMAFLSRAYNFQWSRWNSGAGSRNIVMQIREAVDTKREGKLQLLYVNPQRAEILKCDEMSQEFSTEPMLGLPFFPDLFTLNMSYGSVDARRATFNMKYRLVETVFSLLQELKLCSFS